MHAMHQKKNKINLSDYNFRRDIECRLLLARLNNFEFEVIMEILNGSLKISLKQLSDNLNVPQSSILPIVAKFSKGKLFKIVQDTLFVDKEMRKYYESQISKFEENFEPGMDFLQSLLHKVPIHILTLWYNLPRTSDHIFQAIVDKFLYTPKIYERYLNDLQFDDANLHHIMDAVYSSPDFKVTAHELMRKFNLAHEYFEECMLLLEYNFVCCLSYERIEGGWQEIVTPFHEWKEYKRFLRDTMAVPISAPEKIVPKYTNDFGFIEELTRILELILKKPLPVLIKNDSYKLMPKEVELLFSSSNQGQTIIAKLLFMKLAEIKKEALHPTENTKEWLKKSIQDKALSMSRHPIQVERSLIRVMDSGWIYVDDFLKGFAYSLGSREHVTLKNKGKRWCYTIPVQTDEDIVQIKTTLSQRLLEAGIVSVGTHDKKLCFTVTAFGKMTLSE